MSRYRDVPDDLVYRLFYPAPVYVISAASGKDEDALSAVWVMPVSLKPPRVGVAISPERYSYSLIRKSKFFAVNKLPFRYVQQMAFIGDVSKRYLHNKLDLSGLHIAAGRTSGVRVIKEADAVAECGLVSTLEGGDHDILIGEVKAAYASHEFDAIWDVSRHSYASYVGSTGDGETGRRIFVSADGKVEETRSPRNDAVARRNRDHRSIEEAGFAIKGKEFREAVKIVTSKTGIRHKDVLFLLEEMRRQGLVQLTGRLTATDFE